MWYSRSTTSIPISNHLIVEDQAYLCVQFWKPWHGVIQPCGVCSFFFSACHWKQMLLFFLFLFWQLCFVVVWTSGLSTCACPWPSLRCVPGLVKAARDQCKFRLVLVGCNGCLIETLGPLSEKEMCVYIFVLVWVCVRLCAGLVVCLSVCTCVLSESVFWMIRTYILKYSSTMNVSSQT